MVPAICVAAGALGALGGARPTGLAAVDTVILAVLGAAFARSAVEARSIPVFLACAIAAVAQPEPVPLAFGVLGMLLALARSYRRGGRAVAAAAGGLFWAASVGAPFEPGGRPQILPVAAGLLILVSARRTAPVDFKLWFDRTVFAVGCLVVVVGGLATLSVVNARTHLERSVDLLERGLESARAGDTEAAVGDLQAARRVLERGDRSLGAGWAQGALLIPGLSQNFRALQTTVDEVIDLSTVGIQASREADVDSLRATAGQLDLDAVRRMEAPLAAVLDQLEATDEALDDVEDQWLVPFVRNRLEDLHAEIDDGLRPARLALQAAQTTPSILGGDGARTYLVFFTTPVESRASTGFPGNWAILRFEGGGFTMTEFGRIADLSARLPDPSPTLVGLDEYLNRYDRFGPRTRWDNVPVSPDFPTIAEVVRQMAEQSDMPAIDGLISVDTAGLAAMLALTGPIPVPDAGEPLSSENARRYLELDQYVELANPTRIDVLEQLAQRAVERLTTIDLPGPRELGELLGPAVEDGHLQFVTFAEPEVVLLDELGLSGRYPAVRGDFVGVITSNSGGGKQDVFLRRELDYDVAWDPATGALQATATITLYNDSPSSGLPRVFLGNGLVGLPGAPEIPPGGNYTFLTLYTPWEAIEATLDGEPVLLQTLTELGRNAHSTFILIPPGDARTLTVRLDGQLLTEDYRLDLGSQPLVAPERASVTISASGAGGVKGTGPIEINGDAAVGDFDLTRPTRVTVARR